MSTQADDPLRSDRVSEVNEIWSSASFVADAALVNRTHRVVRERAETIHSQRSRALSLWLPIGLCAIFVVILCTAIWSLLDQYDLSPTGIPDASNQLLVVLLWFLPLSSVVLVLALSRRLRADRESSD